MRYVRVWFSEVITNNSSQVARVLKKEGQWLYITYRQPHFLKPLLTREDIWDLKVDVLEELGGGGGFEYFGFIMKKR